MNILRNARFRRLLIGETVSSFGDSAMFLSLAIWAKDLTGSNASAGLVFLFITVPGLFSPLFGYAVDKVNRKPLLMWMYGAMAVLVLSLLFVDSPDQLWIIYAVAFCHGVFFSTPARSALLKDLLPSADALQARSLLIATREGVRIVSPAAGAAIYVAWGGSFLALLDAATFLFAMALLAGIKLTESQPEAPTGEPFRSQVTAGFRHVRGMPLLLRLIGAMVGFMLIAGLLESAAFAAIEHGLGKSAAFFGVASSVQGAGSVLGGVVAGALVKRLGECRASGVGYALMATGMLLCISGEVGLFLAGVVLNGMGMPLLGVAVGTATQLYTPSRLQGRVHAVVGMTSGGVQSLSIAAGAALIGIIDYRVMYGLIVVAGFASAVSVLTRRPPTPEIVASLADEPQDTRPPARDTKEPVPEGA
ncbi:MFS transporter [Streptomyces sp. NPDC050504]|uniref:MFS transporter n=1 Tax=Streptomyces sp. NPDC050504 TaxID=3365618 RepID=UPI0037B4302D